MAEIKKGDRVKVASIDPGFGDAENPDYQGLLGKTGTVQEVREWSMYPVHVALDGDEDAGWSIWKPSELEVIA